ncbi:odorant receptor 46a-like [Nylanderia fulva]|uniref:odorant receptor 46a-like n=1 Tax=Nylanderia fulva TaxID=613905 RepID=UPI0010FB23EC|nr:odorant receptor 46a-like [Nylanderia fulva]
MRVLQFTFKLLTIAGCWRPESWTSLHKRILYNVYSSIMILIMYALILSQLMDIILIVDNTDDFSDNIFIFVPAACTCIKMTLLLINRKSINLLIHTLTKEPCKPRESAEIKIFHKFDDSIDYWHIKKKLLFRAWFPFDYSSTALFVLLFFHQFLSAVVGSLLNLACDTLIWGLLTHVCCQLEILAYRLKKIIFYTDILRDCILQHYCIFKLAILINVKFRLIMTIQFTMSLLDICFALYQINITTTKAKYLEMIMYMSIMLIQIFFYCWYANEVKLKLYK